MTDLAEDWMPEDGPRLVRPPRPTHRTGIDGHTGQVIGGRGDTEAPVRIEDDPLDGRD